MKVVINVCYGGFSLSAAAVTELAKRQKCEMETDRCDKDLVDIVEKLGKKANGLFSELEVVEIPDDVEWEISEYDGFEHIAEKHRCWP